MVCVMLACHVSVRISKDAYLALSKDLEDGGLDVVGMVVETHVSQHHHGRKKQSSRVGKLLSSDVRGGPVHGLEDGALVANVSGRRETETTNESSAHIRQNVSVQVGHDQNLVVVWQRIGDHLQAGVVQKLSVKLNVGEVLGDIARSAQEEPVGHLHDGGLVHSAHLVPANVPRILEGISQNALRGRASDELDALHNTIDHDMLNTRVFSLGVLTNQNSVHVVVRGLVAGNRSAGPHVGEEVEGPAERQVERDMTLADRSREGAFERNVVIRDALNGFVRNDRLAVLQPRGYIDRLPLDRHVGCRVDILDRLRNLRPDAVALNQRDCEFPIVALGSLEPGDLVLLRGDDGSRLSLHEEQVSISARQIAIELEYEGRKAE